MPAILLLAALLSHAVAPAAAYLSSPHTQSFLPTFRVVEKRDVSLCLDESDDDKSDVSLPLDESGDDKFSFAQRIESVKSGVVGALSGGIALTPFAAFHDIPFNDPLFSNGIAQWEFDTDMGSLQGALFAIVYRYCVREDSNEMLGMGCVGAFVFVRTISRVIIPTYCTAIPLDCGSPLGYFDWNMLGQLALNGLESAALFGAAAAAIEYSFDKGYISKFR